MRSSRATALCGLLLALALPQSAAVASSGQFVWEGPERQTYSVENPPDNRCLDMNQEARAPRNETNRPLTVYSRKDCKGKSRRLAPGQVAPRSVVFKSVKFNPR